MTHNELNEKWLDECRAAMQDFEAPAPADGWEAVAASLDAAAGAAGQSAKATPVIPLRIKLWRAAAVLLLVVLCGWGVWFMANDDAAPKQIASVETPLREFQAPTSAENKEIAQTRKPVGHEKAAIGRKKTDIGHKEAAVGHKETPENRVAEASATSTEKDIAQTTTVDAQGASDTTTTTMPTMPELPPDELRLNDEEEAVLLAMEEAASTRKRHRTQHRVTLGMGASANGLNLAGTFGGMSDEAVNYNPINDPGNPIDNPDNPNNGENGIDTTAHETTPMTKIASAKKAANAVPEESGKVTDSRNHISMSAGVTVSVPLTERLSAVSGITYTELSCDVLVGDRWRDQSLRYVGVPLNLQFTLHESRHWQWYASGGMMLERLLRAERDDKKFDTKKWQWSAGTALGVQWLMSRHCGLYVEPGMTYWLDNGASDVPTFRTEHPCCFSVQAGLRLRL